MNQFIYDEFKARNCLRYQLDLEQTEKMIRSGMERASNFNCEPTWNEDMIRFLKDYWDEFTEFVLADDFESIKV